MFAVGAEVQTFGIPGVKENACFMKELADAERVRPRTSFSLFIILKSTLDAKPFYGLSVLSEFSSEYQFNFITNQA